MTEMYFNIYTGIKIKQAGSKTQHHYYNVAYFSMHG